MSIRNNEDRIGVKPDANPPVPIVNNNTENNDTTSETNFQFTTPTEFVDLPSRGEYYPEDHPLYKQDCVEIRYMTAKDEDILSSKTLLKKGVAIERFLANIFVDKRIKPGNLLVGDKNAIIIASRITGYGSEYKTRILCPVCGTHTEADFDLEEKKTKGAESSDLYDITKTENNTFVVQLPKSEVSVEVKLLYGTDERKLLTVSAQRKKKKLPEVNLTEQFRACMVAVNGHTKRNVIDSFIYSMPALDSRYLRDAMTEVTPNIELKQQFECFSCDYEGEVEVPFTTDFFWPKR